MPGASLTWLGAPPTSWRRSARRCTACTWTTWKVGRATSMDEQHWSYYLSLLAAHEQGVRCACVGCWYEQHPDGQPFPGDRVSSTLCPRHRLALPATVKAPDTLQHRRCA